MKFCGIICEFNPFHNGHRYIIEQAKKQTGEDVICLMSGNFVQRGSASIENKYERAKKAIFNGATAVVEFPTIYACSNAENFAMGAIHILNKLNVDTLAFGIENTNLNALQKIAKLKYENSERFQNAFKNEIQNGINYNTALKRSIATTLNDKTIFEILNKPNNILAIEYLTALLKTKSKIKPLAINRCDNGYYSSTENNEFLSASQIRTDILNGKNIDKFVPKNAKITNFFDKNAENCLKSIQLLKLRTTDPVDLEKFYDYNEGIEYRVSKLSKSSINLDELKANVVTARYREQRVNKLLLYPLLNITKKTVKNSFTCKPAVKLLAIDKENKKLLTSYNKNKITLIKNNKDYEILSKKQKEIIDIDLNAGELYQTIINEPGNQDKKIGTLFI